MLVSESKLRKLVREVIKEQKEQFRVGDKVQVLDIPDHLLGQHEHAQDWAGCDGVIDSIYVENGITYCKVHDVTSQDLDRLRPLKVPCTSEFLRLIFDKKIYIPEE